MRPHASFSTLLFACAIAVPALQIEAQTIFGTSSAEVIAGGLEAVHADMDGDGSNEMILLDIVRGPIVFKWNGVSWKEPPAKLPPRKDGWKAMEIEDLNGDGLLDIVVGGGGWDQIWFNQGSLCFSDRTPISWSNDVSLTTDLMIVDVGNGELAIVKTRDGAPNVIDFLDKDGLVVSRDTLPTPVPNARSQKLGKGDINGDGSEEIVIANLGNANRVYTTHGGGIADITSQVMPARPVPVARSLSTDLVVMDLDGDRLPEVVFANNGEENTYLKNKGGTFEWVMNAFPNSSGPTKAIASGDINGDGFEDLAFANAGEQPLILINNGRGGFTVSPAVLPRSDNPSALLMGDFDRDKDIDLAVVDRIRTFLLSNRKRQMEIPAKTTVGGTLEIRIRATPQVEPQPVIVAASPNLLDTPFVYEIWDILIDPQNMAGIAGFPISPLRSVVTYKIPVPPDSALVGLTLYLQCVIFDARYTYYAVTNQDGTTFGR